MRIVVLAVVVGCSSGAPSAPPEPTVPEATPRLTTSVRVGDPAPAPKVDLSLAVGVEMRRPIEDGRLALIPIIATRELDDMRTFVTLQQGLIDGRVAVAESEGGDYSHVVVTNHATDPLVIVGGELLLDGHQDRMVAHDVVVKAESTQAIDVFCVELGRASGDKWFHPSKMIAELELRSLARHGDQLAVWDRVDAIDARRGLAPATRTYRDAAKQQLGTDDRRAHVLELLRTREDHARMIGFAVAIDRKVVAIERYANPALYQQLEAMLVASYLPAAHGVANSHRELAPADVRSFAGKLGHVDGVDTKL